MELIPLTAIEDAEVYRPELDATTLHLLLADKAPTQAEIELILFEQCNLDCTFCYQDETSTVGQSYSEILAKAPTVSAHIAKVAPSVDEVRLSIAGGELFQHKLLDDLLPAYRDLVLAAKVTADAHGVGLVANFTSNFTFKRADRVRGLLDDLIAAGVPAKIVMSYDPVGRRNAKRAPSNEQELAGYIAAVNMVGTRQTLHALQHETPARFIELYSRYPIFLDYFVPEPGAEDKIPLDSQLLEFYTWAAAHYPELASPVGDVGESMHCSSLNGLKIYSNGQTSNCRRLAHKQADFTTEFNLNDNSGVIEHFMQSNGCLACPHFSRCRFQCFTLWDFRWRHRDLDFCWIGRLFDRIG